MKKDYPDITQKEASRRNFIVTSLIAGFAFAVQPINSQTVINTDASSLLAGEVKIPVRDGEIPAYRAMPKNGRGLPVVLDRFSLR